MRNAVGCPALVYGSQIDRFANVLLENEALEHQAKDICPFDVRGHPELGRYSPGAERIYGPLDLKVVSQARRYAKLAARGRRKRTRLVRRFIQKGTRYISVEGLRTSRRHLRQTKEVKSRDPKSFDSSNGQTRRRDGGIATLGMRFIHKNFFHFDAPMSTLIVPPRASLCCLKSRALYLSRGKCGSAPPTPQKVKLHSRINKHKTNPAVASITTMPHATNNR